LNRTLGVAACAGRGRGAGLFARTKPRQMLVQQSLKLVNRCVRDITLGDLKIDVMRTLTSHSTHTIAA
jgi:hypothetical protein